ncbi:MAG: hypothetical protein ACTSQY_10975, partial [Candidatus Odinarchaeia archaeon]
TMGVELPKLTQVECSDNEYEHTSEAKRREKRAINYYILTVNEVTEPRAKEIFTAFIEIEKAHLDRITHY